MTTGGIGPTHDDITADAVARAFGVSIGEDPRAMAIMMERYLPEDLTPARRRMARIPAGADLIDNPISKAPGFRIGNVFVLAGVPSVMQAMLDFAVKSMRTGAVMLIETVEAGAVPEGRYGEALGRIAAAHPAVSIGSYPSFKDGRFNNQIVVRGKEEGRSPPRARRSSRCWSPSEAMASRSERWASTRSLSPSPPPSPCTTPRRRLDPGPRRAN